MNFDIIREEMRGKRMTAIQKGTDGNMILKIMTRKMAMGNHTTLNNFFFFLSQEKKLTNSNVEV